MPEHSFTVTGMSCGGCEENVESAVGELDGVTSVSADHEGETVTVAADGVSDGTIRDTIEKAGYDVTGTA